jgi:hypothetical protein
MSEQEKDNQVAVSSLFTAAMIGGISVGGILGAKAVVKFVLYSSDMGQVRFLATCSETKGLFPR